MRKLLIAAALMLPMMLCGSSASSGTAVGKSENTVYVCTGKSAKNIISHPVVKVCATAKATSSR